jgi:hypothetical protein
LCPLSLGVETLAQPRIDPAVQSRSIEPSRDPADSDRVLAELHAHDRAHDRFVAAADEAGRGCLAGPLVGAAVLFDLDRPDLLELLDA